MAVPPATSSATARDKSRRLLPRPHPAVRRRSLLSPCRLNPSRLDLLLTPSDAARAARHHWWKTLLVQELSMPVSLSLLSRRLLLCRAPYPIERLQVIEVEAEDVLPRSTTTTRSIQEVHEPERDYDLTSLSPITELVTPTGSEALEDVTALFYDEDMSEPDIQANAQKKHYVAKRNNQDNI
ncbi:hypothetical protein EJB05_08771 [Eragrostis curvula]|uniref:Uncharacterized protein n=1 Tax=Eragrostis curvula TaxID=38414 RepID=A0A5J9W1R4_9POAL|nr:hypothetical protein EJB05_08771 [Eragrostis curvula]